MHATLVRMAILTVALSCVDAQSQTDRLSDLAHLIGKEGSFWTEPAGNFADRHGDIGFRWSSPPLVSQVRAKHPGLRFAGLKVWEAFVDFEASHPSKVTLLLYSRGDIGDLSRAEFERLTQQVRDALSSWCGSPPTEIQTPHERASRNRIMRTAWVCLPHRLDLACGSTHTRTFRAEFVRLSVTPFDQDDDPRTRPIFMPTHHGVISAFSLRDRIAQTPEGDVYVSGIPMVDQGNKGYCAVATAERLLRFFERGIDQHELAQAVDASAELGTNPETMVRVLRGICGKVGLKVRILERLEGKDYLRIVRDYNRAAKKQDVDPITADGRVIIVSQLYGEMESGILQSVRTKNRSAVRRFRKTVKTYVDGGIPLAWSVILGKFPESPPLRQYGGHLRMIIGYNQASGELLYSDSWGPGHEIKRMRLVQAWTITTGLYSVFPENIRL